MAGQLVGTLMLSAWEAMPSNSTHTRHSTTRHSTTPSEQDHLPQHAARFLVDALTEPLDSRLSPLPLCTSAAFET